MLEWFVTVVLPEGCRRRFPKADKIHAKLKNQVDYK